MKYLIVTAIVVCVAHGTFIGKDDHDMLYEYGNKGADTTVCYTKSIVAKGKGIGTNTERTISIIPSPDDQVIQYVSCSTSDKLAKFSMRQMAGGVGTSMASYQITAKKSKIDCYCVAYCNSPKDIIIDVTPIIIG